MWSTVLSGGSPSPYNEDIVFQLYILPLHVLGKTYIASSFGFFFSFFQCSNGAELITSIRLIAVETISVTLVAFGNLLRISEMICV